MNRVIRDTNPLQQRAKLAAADIPGLIAPRLITYDRDYTASLGWKGATKNQFVSELSKNDSGLKLSQSQLIGFYNEFATR